MYRMSPDDTPANSKPKICLLYAAGMKIYGVLPHLLNMQVGGQFVSNMMGPWVLPTGESNYTIVRYRRKDGTPHSPSATSALRAWLMAGAGCEVYGVLPPHFYRSLDGPNAFGEKPPCVRINLDAMAGFSDGQLAPQNEGDNV